jgi:DNA-directed RNA polymerase subunit L
MKVEILENEKDTLKLRIYEGLTLANLLNENLWKQKIDYAAYKVDHPYLSQPEVVVKGTNPKKAVIDAAEQIVSDVKDLRKNVQRSLK